MTQKRFLRFTEMDGLRGLAACVVVLAHVAQVFIPHLFDASLKTSHGGWEEIVATSPLNLLVHGQFAVAVFFVLSGFVLSIKFIDVPSPAQAIYEAVKRVPRLSIPITASLLLVWLLHRMSAFSYAEAAIVTKATMRDFYSEPLGVGQALWGGLWGWIWDLREGNPVLWTMRYELQGSLMIFAMGAVGMHWLTFPVALLFAAWMQEALLFAFPAGAALACVAGRCSFRIRPQWIVPAVALAALFGSFPYYAFDAVIPYSFLTQALPDGLPVQRTYWVLGAVLLVFATRNSAAISRMLRSKIPRYLGRISFGLYLVHFPLVCSLGTSVFLWAYSFTGYWSAVIFAAVASLTGSVVVADTLSRWVDQPLTAVLRTFAWRRSAQN